MDRKPAFILSIIITLILFCGIYILSSEKKTERKKFVVSRIIDGDTIETSDGAILRLLNINTPEKGKPGYEYSILYLSQFVNKSLEMEELGTEKYGRTIARIYSPEHYLNLELVKKGFAIKFLVNEREIKDFAKAEEEAIAESRGMWKKSKYYGCINAEIDAKKEILRLKNSCEKLNIKNWVLKDESRKEFKFPEVFLLELQVHTLNGTDNQTDIFWKSGGNVWNDDRDTVYLFDTEGKIVYHEAYGY